ncbi:MAG: hypothetical protein K2X62_06500 [Beijerinckiaceae bacterium]|nr:hypothetical protein [Beijerinckiaceae bacterium]MDO9440240.1 hypothetical protein [Beijerinckiaceae bacterium]
MPNFNDILFELRQGLEDPEDLSRRMSSQLDPDLVDRLNAFGASRAVTLPESVLRAVELFMLRAAEDAWAKLSDDEGAEAPFGGVAMNVVLEQYLSASLDLRGQKLLHGAQEPAPLKLFRRRA